MKPVVIYGIPNCDVTKKALAWLTKNNIPFDFNDYKKQGITAYKLSSWCAEKGWEVLVNKRGTTWKTLSPGIQQAVNSENTAIKLMQEHTSLIKRPVIEVNGTILIGYDEAVYRSTLLNT